jgi:hypothetical protein
VTAGAAGTVVTVTGSGFTATTALQVGGVIEPTTYVSATQMTATVPAAQLVNGGLLSVIAENGGATSAAGPAVNLTVSNPTPVITSFIPSTFTTGAAAQLVTVTGTGFDPSTVIQAGGSDRATAFVNSTQLTVALPAADFAAAGNVSLAATNPAPGGGASPVASIAVNNPVPGIRALNPRVVVTGATTATTVTLSGSGLVPNSQVQVGGTDRATTFVSSTQLTFQLTVADQAVAGLLGVTVINPAPGGGASFPFGLTLGAPTLTPVISQVLPGTLIVGSSATTITVQGANLTPNTTVLWNGTALQTTGYGFGPVFGSGSSFTTSLYLSASVPANLLTTAGTATVTVSSPTATPAVSNAVTVKIATPPAPTLTGVSPVAIPINTATTVTLTGTGFTTASTVALNGTTVPSTYSNSSQLTVALPATGVTLPGNYNFTVTTPAPGGGTTPPLPVTAYVGIVNNSMIFNPMNGLLYLSVPSSAGATYGNSIVSVDPETGALGTPIRVGSEPNKLALSSDGTILWVGLDGASAVRQVNLTTGTAGLQFSLGGSSQTYSNPATAFALAALPGSPNSVVVATQLSYIYEGVLGIYDSGVLRGTATPATNFSNTFYALQVDGTLNEIHAGGSTYSTYTYGSTGLTLTSSSPSGNAFANTSSDEMQVAGGTVYTDFGQASDAESGVLLGTFYVTGSTVARGPVFADKALGKVFILDSSSSAGYYNSFNQIQVFNLADYSATGSAIPVSAVVPSGYSSTVNYNPSRLTRWGSNGLAFRTGAGVFSVRSNLVKDLSTTSADLGVTLAASGAGTTGTNTTYNATVTNAGPSASTNIALTALVPSTGVLLSATPSVGTCSTANGVSCNLGGLANGAIATVTFVVQQTTAGSAALTVQVSGAENDPAQANNSATSTATVTGATYNVVPVVSAISPNAVQAGATDTTITVTGSGFGSAATVQLGGTALTTSYTNSTKLTATVPAAQVATLGWAPVTVSNPAPGGGGSNPVPLTIFSVLTLGVNHLLYDPFSRNIMASVGSGSSTVTGNSIVAITPQTGSVGTAVPIGSQPTSLALTSDGQILYTILAGSQSVARFNMLTQTADFTYAVPNSSNFLGGVGLRGIATQPGTENTVALELASFTGNAIYDFNPTAKTAAIRGQVTGPYSGSCLAFLDAGNLFAYENGLDHYTVTSAGFQYYNYSQYTQSTLNHFGCFKLSGGLAYATGGGVANPATVPATQIGVFPVNGGFTYSDQSFVPDASLQRSFYLVNIASIGSPNYGSGSVDGIEVFDHNTFLPTSSVNLNMPAIEGNTSYSGVDAVRWGQDGLAILTSGGHIYLLRGPVVVPQELSTSSAATLTASSVTTIAHGTGNTLLTLTGSNFLPGVAVTWNGSYRTTTIVDTTHVTVAIPASDLAAAGSGSLMATNPGGAASSALTVTVN